MKNKYRSATHKKAMWPVLIVTAAICLLLSINVFATPNSVKVRTMWDNTNLYLAFEITDSQVENTLPDPWSQDAIELYLDASNDHTTSIEPAPSDDYQWIITAANVAYPYYSAVGTTIQKAVTIVSGGYNVEMAIPWTQIYPNTTPAAGRILGALFANDDQDGGVFAGTFDWKNLITTDGWYGNPSHWGDITLSATEACATTPALTVAPTSLATYGNVTVNTTSAEQTYLLTGSNLTADVTVTAPTGYQVSKTTASGFATSVSVTQSSGTVSQTIYARFTPTLVQAYNGNISNVSGGATTQNVAVTGSGVSGGSGSLGGSVNTSTAAENLATVGTADWAHFSPTFDHKSSGGSQISNYTQIGTFTVANNSTHPKPLTWTGGTPTASSTNNTNALQLDDAANGKGFSITVPADLTSRTLYLYLGGWRSSGTLTATLSDASAAVYTNTQTDLVNTYTANYVITYNAASAGKTLTVTWVKTAGSNVILFAGAALVTNGTPTPALSVAPTSLATYGNVTINTTSAEQTYLLTGSNLTANVTVTAPTGYQVSKTTASGFATSVSVTQSSGTVSQTIYARFTPTAVQAYNGNISNVSGGATTQNVAVTGTGIGVPALTVAPTSLATYGNVTINTTSAEKTYLLTGSNLTANVTVTAPTGYQVSKTTATGFATSVSVTQSSGTVSQTIYARFTPTAVQAYNGNISNVSGGATTQNVAVTGSGVSAGTDASVAKKATGTITINGTLSECDWANANYSTFTDPQGLSNNTLKVRTMWDNTNLYVAYEVTDSQIEAPGGNSWEQDAIELYLDASDNKTTNVEATDDYQWIITAANVVDPYYGAVGKTIQRAITTVSGSYIVEMAIPWTQIYPYTTPAAGRVLGADFVNDDRDGGVYKGTFDWKNLASGGYARPNLWGDITLSATTACATTPALTVNPTSLAYGSVTVNTTSTEQTYLLTGSNLTANVTVTAPAGFTVSKTTGTGFATSVTVTPTSGSVNQTIYVRLAPTAVQAYNGNITNASTGATTQNVALTGSGTNALVAKKAISAITINGSLSDWAAYANSVTFTNATYSNNTLKVSTLWDNTNLYIAYEVTDSQIEAPGGNSWEQDAIELYLDASNNMTTTIDADDYQWIITAANVVDPYYAAVGKTIQKSIATTGSGYIVEIAIPWTQLSKTPANGLLLGADFVNDDRDNSISNTFDWMNLVAGGYPRPNLWGDIILSDLTKSATIATGLGTIVNSEKLTVYPNPANEFLTIELTGIEGKQQIQLFNSIGSLVKEVELTGSTQIDISGLTNGLYFVHLKNHSLKNQKFIKQ